MSIVPRPQGPRGGTLSRVREQTSIPLKSFRKVTGEILSQPKTEKNRSHIASAGINNKLIRSDNKASERKHFKATRTTKAARVPRLVRATTRVIPGTVSYTHLTLPTIPLVQISVVAVSLKKKEQISSTL
eukprot:TRINITY_DN48476_c0_g1_i1.p2 TRINITY_DN48476_c0_g1~~TRINITY_DN48476_c0_g1_i1.p2  ORF type:complete len:130 (-),score=13.81 TRINITY_DN48476_c0_g1_i1:40-429(-)